LCYQRRRRSIIRIIIRIIIRDIIIAAIINGIITTERRISKIPPNCEEMLAADQHVNEPNGQLRIEQKDRQDGLSVF